MDLFSKDQFRCVLGRTWVWWKKDFTVLGEPVGPRWWYLVILMLVMLEAWWESIAGPGRIVEIVIYQMR